MRNPTEILKILREKSQDKSYRFQRLYRNLYNPEFYYLAYNNICTGQGNMTEGVDGQTIDGMSAERIDKIIATLKDHSTKYCHNSPSVKEETLHVAILAAINSAMSNKQVLIDCIKDAMSLELLPVQGQQMSLADMERRLEQLDQKFQKLLAEVIDCEDKDACNARFAAILQEQTVLKRQKEEILQSCADAEKICNRMKQAEQVLEEASPAITEWNEITIRQLVERVTVVSADEICVSLKDGAEIHQRLE